MANGKVQSAIQSRIRELQPGMVLARTVYSRDGCPLLHEGKELTEKDIERLENWRQRFVYVWPDKQSAPDKELEKAS
ncbi:MAG: hypothetical protein ACQEP7_01155 [bacterium]